MLEHRYQILDPMTLEGLLGKKLCKQDMGWFELGQDISDFRIDCSWSFAASD